MSARVLASPAAEVRRLRGEVRRVAAERDALRRMVADLVAALPDLEAEIRYRRLLCAETAEAVRETYRAEGRAEAEAELAAAWRAVAAQVAAGGAAHDELDLLRWGPGGRERFGEPRPGDYMGGPLPCEHPGEVYLAGPPVHRHRCTVACHAYAAGWYTPAEAARILATLPGNYPRTAAA